MHRVGTLHPGAVGEDPDEATRPEADAIPELIDPEPTAPHPHVRRPPDLFLFELIAGVERWEETDAERLRVGEGIDGYDQMTFAHDVPWASLHAAFIGTSARTVVVRYVEETPDEGRFLDPMLTYDVWEWVGGRRRMRSFVVSMTEVEP